MAKAKEPKFKKFARLTKEAWAVANDLGIAAFIVGEKDGKIVTIIEPRPDDPR